MQQVNGNWSPIWHALLLPAEPMGLIIECHPEPDKSVSDARQALSLGAMVDLVHSLEPIALAVGRTLGNASGVDTRQLVAV